MLAFFEQWGAAILSALVATASLAGSIYGLVKTFKTGKKVDQNIENTNNEIQITREGVVEAFKTAKIPNEWKISVSNQINTTLTKWRDDMITLVKENQAVANDLLYFTLKILSFTAASNKLTDEEKARLDELVRQISGNDATIDITE